MSPAPLPNVYWLGGSPCAGKSSIARWLAERYPIRRYSIDDEFPRHAQTFTPERQPVLYHWTHTSWNDLWSQPVEVLLEQAIAAYAEHFDLALIDLQSLPPGETVLAEGTAFLPGCLAPYAASPRQMWFLVPSSTFQLEYYAKREDFVNGILSQCQNPEQAFQHWMERDVRFAEWITGQARHLGFDVQVVDGSLSIEDLAREAARRFGLI